MTEPAYVPLPTDPDARARFLLACNPDFRAIVRRSEGSGGRAIPHDKFWEMLEKRFGRRL